MTPPPRAVSKRGSDKAAVPASGSKKEAENDIPSSLKPPATIPVDERSPDSNDPVTQNASSGGGRASNPNPTCSHKPKPKKNNEEEVAPLEQQEDTKEPEPEELADSDLLQDRVQACLNYTRSCLSSGSPIMQYTRFTLSPSLPSHQPVLHALRQSAALTPQPLATLISSSPQFETYELGCPRPADYAAVHAAYDGNPVAPDWWVGKSAAEIRAGPMADERDVRRIEGELSREETRRRSRRSSTVRREYPGMVKMRPKEDEDEDKDEDEEDG